MQNIVNKRQKLAYDYEKAKVYEIWMNLLFSEWFFGILFNYINLDDVARLDMSICNIEDRRKWLEFLKTISFSIELQNDENLNNKINWLVLKTLHINELSFKFDTRKNITLSNTSILQLAKTNSNLKSLKIEVYSLGIDSKGFNLIEFLGDKFFNHISNFCNRLESLCINGALYKGSLTTLAESCRNLKNLRIQENPNLDLKELTILISRNHIKTLNIEDFGEYSDILTIVGNHCPTLQYFSWFVNDVESHTLLPSDEQIEIFTKGCKNLISLQITGISSGKCNKLFQCLGTYNPFLENLELLIYEENKEIITAYSLACLSKGCSVLKTIKFSRLHLLKESLESMAAYSLCIEKLHLLDCDIEDDGFAEIGKLRCMKSFILNGRNNLVTDKGILDLVKINGHNLEEIGLFYCHNLSNQGLYTIADYCPNLKKIEYWEDRKNHQIILCFSELFNKCKKLIDIILVCFILVGNKYEKFVEIDFSGTNSKSGRLQKVFQDEIRKRRQLLLN